MCVSVCLCIFFKKPLSYYTTSAFEVGNSFFADLLPVLLLPSILMLFAFNWEKYVIEKMNEWMLMNADLLFSLFFVRCKKHWIFLICLLGVVVDSAVALLKQTEKAFIFCAHPICIEYYTMMHNILNKERVHAPDI